MTDKALIQEAELLAERIVSSIAIERAANPNLTKSAILFLSTGTQPTNCYLTPIRQVADTVFIGVVVNNTFVPQQMAKLLDGEFDYFIIDAEKKIPLSVSGDLSSLDTGNLSKKIGSVVTQSNLLFFKPSDVTVEAAWSQMSALGINSGGELVAILGMGNIGTKLALRCLESGLNVRISRRDHAKGREISNVLSMICGPNVLSNISYHESSLSACFRANLVLGTASTHDLIDLEHVLVADESAIFFDLGKDNISVAALDQIENTNRYAYRVDVTDALRAKVLEAIETHRRMSSVEFGKREEDGVVFCSRGILARSGEIIV